MVLKIVDLCSFRNEMGGGCCCLHLFYCIQIMDGLISASPSGCGTLEREEGTETAASLSIQMCIVNERINDGN